MPQLDFDGANSKISADKIQGQSGTTVTIPAGHNLAGDGSGLTSLSAANITSGGTLPALNGSALTNLPAHSGNVAFPATQVASADANTLDDYEEGTWTPTLGGDATYSIQSGKYTKIGRMVYVGCVLSVTTLGTGSTSLLSGFPYTSNNAGGGNMGGGIFYFASLAVNVIAPTLYKAHGTTSTNFKSNTSAGTGVSGNLAIFGNSARVDFSMTYEVS